MKKFLTVFILIVSNLVHGQHSFLTDTIIRKDNSFITGQKIDSLVFKLFKIEKYN